MQDQPCPDPLSHPMNRRHGFSATSPPLFGDGLSGLGGKGVRLGTKTVVGGNATYPGPGDSSIRARGFILVAGGRRGYRVWYRDSPVFCMSASFNLTNGIQIDWAR